ncbi:MAG: hypothetical protein CXT67_00170 [Methanobacteriota archaeon]|nr:MAG: hypothetical protein CXT67_00170 [Euryarchaeota archaeon]
MIHFRIRDDTLCGAEYTEPSKKAAKDGRLCDDCVNMMWKEQYRRNTLMAYIRKARVIAKGDAVSIDDSHLERGNAEGLYLKDYLTT